jgi:hypothetical protein
MKRAGPHLAALIPPNPFAIGQGDTFLTEAELDAAVAATDPALFNNGGSESINPPPIDPDAGIQATAAAPFRVFQFQSPLGTLAIIGLIGAAIWTLTRGR